MNTKEQTELDNQAKMSLHILNSVMNNLSNLIFYKDTNFNYLGCNIGFEKFMGRTKEELVGHNDFDFFPQELAKHFRALDQKIFDGGEAVINPQWVTYPDGSKVYLHTTTTPFYDMDGKVMGLVGNSVDITKEKLLSDKLEHEVNYDHLTKIPNRALLMDRLGQSLLQAKREENEFALFFMDLDEFKPINDEFGHKYGDLVLQKVAQRLTEALRESDTVARLGGDEFAAIVHNVKDEEDIISLAENLIELVGKSMHIEGKTLKITLSVGIAFCKHSKLSADELLSLADDAMYMAKDKGKNCYIIARS